jgi:alpha-L-rhamnosidase
MLSDMAEAVGDNKTLAGLTDWLGELQPNFHAAFYNSRCGCYGSGSQTEQAMALWAGVPPSQAVSDAVTAYLVTDITIAQSNHILTGILGTRYVFEALSRAGGS